MIEQDRKAERLDLARQLREKRQKLSTEIEEIDRIVESLENPKIRKHYARRYAVFHSLADAMVVAIANFERPADPVELLQELESGMYGFKFEDSQTDRLAHMARAYKNDGTKRIAIVDGNYQLSTSQPK